jgi:hypothetical protein
VREVKVELLYCIQNSRKCWGNDGKFERVFVGAFSEFGGLVYRIPAPILGGFRQKSSFPHE